MRERSQTIWRGSKYKGEENIGLVKCLLSLMLFQLSSDNISRRSEWVLFHISEPCRARWIVTAERWTPVCFFPGKRKWGKRRGELSFNIIFYLFLSHPIGGSKTNSKACSSDLCTSFCPIPISFPCFSHPVREFCFAVKCCTIPVCPTSTPSLWFQFNFLLGSIQSALLQMFKQLKNVT